MPRPDIIHDVVKHALIKDGWTITHDPFKIRRGRVKLYADLAAERQIANERTSRLIVVEVKSFTGKSLLKELENALGQYLLYLGYLEIIAPERKLYLAMSDTVYDKLVKLEDLERVLRRFTVSMIVVNVKTEEVIQWIS
jgi:hypothetical protein